MTDKEKRKLLMDEFGQNIADLVQISDGHLADHAKDLEATAAKIEESAHSIALRGNGCKSQKVLNIFASERHDGKSH